MKNTIVTSLISMRRVPTTASWSAGKFGATTYATVPCLFAVAAITFLTMLLVFAPRLNTPSVLLSAIAVVAGALVCTFAVTVGFCALFPLSEFESRRAIDLEGDELMLVGGRSWLAEARPVICQFHYSDLHPQVEIVVAGNPAPFIYSPDSVVWIAEPIFAKKFPHDEQQQDVLNAVFGAVGERLETWVEQAPKGQVDAAKLLGLLERKPLGLGWRWSKSSQVLRNVLEFLWGDAVPAGAPVVVELHGNVVINISGDEFRMDELIDQLAAKISSSNELKIIEEIRSAASDQDSERLRSGFLELGKDVVIGVMGSAAWAAMSAGRW